MIILLEINQNYRLRVGVTRNYEFLLYMATTICLETKMASSFSLQLQLNQFDFAWMFHCFEFSDSFKFNVKFNEKEKENENYSFLIS